MEVAETDAKAANELGFMARMCVLAGLPHSDPGDVPAWGRRNGNYSLAIQPGVMIDEHGKPISLGIPYGTIPRLALIWLSTEAVRNKSPEIILGHGIVEFMRNLGMTATGGGAGSISRLNQQLRKLLSSSISCTYSEGTNWANAGFRLVDESCLFWTPSQHRGGAENFIGKIVLGSKFYEEIAKHSVPTDMRVVRALSKSPLCLDIYIWLVYRLSYLRKDSVIPWHELLDQFGADYGRARDFKPNFNKCLARVRSFYPQAKAFPIEHGLLLKPSPLHIKRKHACG